MKKQTPALAGLALAFGLAAGSAGADDLSAALEQAREFGALAHTLRTNPTPEDIHAAAMLLEMQVCYELNAAVMDAASPVSGAVRDEALACLQRLHTDSDALDGGQSPRRRHFPKEPLPSIAGREPGSGPWLAGVDIAPGRAREPNNAGS